MCGKSLWLVAYLHQQLPPSPDITNVGRIGRSYIHRWVHLQAELQLSTDLRSAACLAVA